MGLFSGIKKLGKKIFKGVKKVFKKVGKFVGKVMKSKWFKVLMIAASVVTGGLALAAGVGAFTGQAAGATFLTKFVAGAKAFTGALLNPVGAAKGAMQGAAGGGGLAGAAQGAAAGQGIFNTGVAATQGMAGQAAATGAGAAAPSAATAGVTNTGTGVAAATPAATTAATAAPPAGNLLQKAATGATNFIKSPGGGTVISNMVQGYAQGKQQEAMLKEQERIRRYYDKSWEDPGQLAELEAATSGSVNVPEGYMQRARRYSQQTERPVETVGFGGGG